VHHDVWDYDLPAQPTLARIDTAAGRVVPECRRRLISMRLLHCTPNHAAGHRCVKLPQVSLPNVQNPAVTFWRGLIALPMLNTMDRRTIRQHACRSPTTSFFNSRY
jgi:hypothetical protein